MPGQRPGGAAELKRVLTESVNEFLRPLRARRAELISDRGYLRQVLRAGNGRANMIAESTLTEVRNEMGTNYG
jgi:tryptophanyl-tRNA synthetase